MNNSTLLVYMSPNNRFRNLGTTCRQTFDICNPVHVKGAITFLSFS